jgi:hypothetical protein
MCYWILPQSGIPIARTTIQAIPKTELDTTEVQDQLKHFDTIILEKLNASNDLAPDFHLYREDKDPDAIDDELVGPEAQSPEIDNIEVDAYDEILLTQPLLMKDGTICRAKILGHKRDENGNPIGNYHSNPLLNSRIYIAEFKDGQTAEYSANTIAEAIYNQINEEGYEETIFEEIIGHERNKEAMSIEQAKSLKEAYNQSSPIYTTKGWQICIAWKNDTTSWHSLADIKNSYPLQLAEYAVKHDLQNEPAFAWWVKPALKKRKYLIKALRARYAKRSKIVLIRYCCTLQKEHPMLTMSLYYLAASCTERQQELH